MLGKAVLCLTLQFYGIAAQDHCTDLRGRVISHGLHFVPGPDTCTLCVCDNGSAKVCKAVLCSPPQDCRSFRVGNTCCEFICLDDVVKPAEGAEANVRMAAGGAAAIVLLTVALVVYRVRKQKRRRPPHTDDQRSLTSIGYISGSMGYMGGSCETALGGWKPSAPRGEAPPPYDEAVAQCRQENMRLVEASFHRTFPATVDPLARPDEPVPCAGHYGNVPRPLTQLANPASCYTAPLLQAALEPREPAPHSLPAPPNMVGFPSAIRLTGSLGAISNRGLLSVLPREPDHERPHNVPGFYTHGANVHTSLHRSIPRPAECALDAALGACSRADRALGAHARRSFRRPGDARTVPRALDLASATDVSAHSDNCSARLSSGGRSRAHSEEHNVGGTEPRARAAPDPPATPAPAPAPPANAPLPPASPASATTATVPPATLPLTVDQPSCVCSYECAGGAGAEDADDYRSECENCKAAGGSRWVLEEGWEGAESEGTQTLQRRAPAPAAPPAPATATLPQPVTKPSRSMMGPPSNWENWFNTIPDSDSESEEE